MSKTIIITGGSDGIGAAAARTLVDHGHRVVIVGRSESKTRKIAAELGIPCYVAEKRLYLLLPHMMTFRVTNRIDPQ
ncbi:SDR family NAD(P)-dependent oxidoreductase, partial [Glutamicibacter bergerei]